MPTPEQIMDISAAALNDTAQSIFTDTAQLPYLNMALRELQEIYELNDIPVTHDTSDVINCPEGTDKITFSGSPQLPAGLIEIKQLWESPEDQDQWTPMVKKDFLPHYQQSASQKISQFLVWAWIDNEVKLIAANQDNDIKIDMIKNIFATPITTDQFKAELGFRLKNIDSFLGFKTGAFCAMFIGENETRALALNQLAEQAIARSLGISVKEMQQIMVRRRPFRFGYKMRGRIW